jgi:hypothetical protein
MSEALENVVQVLIMALGFFVLITIAGLLYLAALIFRLHLDGKYYLKPPETARDGQGRPLHERK